MKNFLLLFFMLNILFSSNAQVTNNPIVDNISDPKCKIDIVRLTSEFTVITLRIFMNDGQWATISPKTRIEYYNPETGLLETMQILRLEDVNGVTMSMGAKYYKPSGAFGFQKYPYLPSSKFVLIFPNIPKGVNKINLIESRSWKWYGINITPRNDFDVKRLATVEEEIDQLIANSKDTNAGMYEQLSSNNPYRLAFVQTDEGTFLIYVGSTYSVGSWKCGEVKAILRPTVSKSIYKADWYMGDKTVSPVDITFEGAAMTIHSERPDDVYVKMSRGSISDDKIINSEKWSGTGFALKSGYILTNYHVVEKANEINIYGINGDYENGIKATVFGFDKSNDLALLKLSGEIPESFNSIPYSFKSIIADVGEDVYVLGYPLTATMGEEVKLTNGIISARTGFEGDVSQYQISVPVQPGNSGGPLIDYNGNVIGVVCAKHRGAENVSYAVKVSQVRNLIESVSDLSIMNTTNSLQGKSLKDQVKFVNKYVYIIKCNK